MWTPSLGPLPDLGQSHLLSSMAVCLACLADVEVSYVDAILGTTVQVTTVDGPVDLKIPAGGCGWVDFAFFVLGVAW